MSRLLNPAVRGMTAAVKAASTFARSPSGPRVSGLPPSATSEPDGADDEQGGGDDDGDRG